MRDVRQKTTYGRQQTPSQEDSCYVSWQGWLYVKSHHQMLGTHSTPALEARGDQRTMKHDPCPWPEVQFHLRTNTAFELPSPSSGSSGLLPIARETQNLHPCSPHIFVCGYLSIRRILSKIIKIFLEKKENRSI